MPAVCNVRATPVRRANGRKTYVVVDDDGAIIEDIDDFLAYLRGNANSENTIEAYARHLALLFRWLTIRGSHWEDLTLQGLSAFAMDLRDGSLRSLQRVGTYRPQTERKRRSCEAVMAAVYSFLEYWRNEGQRGPADLTLYRNSSYVGNSTQAFLSHVESRRPQKERLIKIRGPKPDLPRIIDFEDDFALLLAAANTHRDRALLSAMYDGGVRIGQALGLKHEDLDMARKRIWIQRREDNPNDAISKQRTRFPLSMPDRFFTLYGRSLVDEQLMLGIDSDFVFVNLAPGYRGAPMSAPNAGQIIAGISQRAGVRLTPHTLRHTHGTALARDGWTQPQIAERLGQSQPSSADVYIHLAADHIESKYQSSDLAKAQA